tara:strand:+ start:1697 stop:2170 length:474 start_codon:yes stop_codon:yes gene_type:complete
MAKRRGGKKARRSRSRNTGFNIKSAIFAYATLAVTTRAITNAGPIQFLTEGYVGTAAQREQISHDPSVITMKEIFSGSHLGPNFASNQQMTYLGTGPVSGAPTLGQTVMTNLQANAVPAVFTLVGLKVADKLVTKLGVSRNFNKLVKDVGMKGVVRA